MQRLTTQLSTVADARTVGALHLVRCARRLGRACLRWSGTAALLGVARRAWRMSLGFVGYNFWPTQGQAEAPLQPNSGPWQGASPLSTDPWTVVVAFVDERGPGRGRLTFLDPVSRELYQPVAREQRIAVPSRVHHLNPALDFEPAGGGGADS